jgi:hypothetical protein
MGSSLPVDERGDSKDKQDHADGQPWPRTPFVLALLPTCHGGADGPGSAPVQIRHVEHRDGKTGYQARQSTGRLPPPDQQQRCEHRERQDEQSNRRDPDEAEGIARANEQPGREPYPRQPGERPWRRHKTSLPTPGKPSLTTRPPAHGLAGAMDEGPAPPVGRDNDGAFRNHGETATAASDGLGGLTAGQGACGTWPRRFSAKPLPPASFEVHTDAQ